MSTVDDDIFGFGSESTNVVAVEDEPDIIFPGLSNRGPIKVPEGVTPNSFYNVVNGAYNAYLSDGRPPNVERVKSFVPHTLATVAKVMGTNEFKLALAERGVSWTVTDGLTAQQSLVISLLMNISDRRSFASKLKSAGVSRATYRAWCKNPVFKRFLEQQSEGVLKDHQSDVLVKLTQKAADQGDIRAIQLFLEITGRHNPAQQQQMDVQSTLLRVIEIITKHVKDKETLTAIAAEMQFLGGVAGYSNTTPVGTTIKGELT